MTTETNLDINFLWVPKSLGGHSGPPWDGMRLTIRWQRHVDACLERSWDVEAESLSFDAGSRQGTGRFRVVSGDPVPPEWVRDGALVEFLGGFRVLAVGKIVGSTVKSDD